MKLASLLLAALAATSSVQAGTLGKWCQYPGQGCVAVKNAVDTSHQVKRSADALAEAVKSFKMDRWCAFPGQGCVKAKRALEAVNEVQRTTDALSDAIVSLEGVEEDE